MSKCPGATPRSENRCDLFDFSNDFCASSNQTIKGNNKHYLLIIDDLILLLHRTRTPIAPSASGSKTAGPKWHVLSSV